MIPKFSIYYADGTRYDGGGEDDEVVTLQFSKKWLEAPSDGVLVIVAADSKLNRTVLCDMDFFYGFPLNHHGKGTQGCSNSLGAYLRSVGLVKFGGWTDTENFEQAKVRANGEKDHIDGVALRGPPVVAASRED